jgi:integral membrane sensor domain MASE1
MKARRTMHPPVSPVTTPPPGAAVLVARAVAVAGVYYLAAKVGLEFRSEPGKLAVFWPPNGLLLGLLLLSGPATRRLAILSAASACFLANLAGGNPVLVSAGFTAVNIAEPCAVAWVLRKLGTGDTRLERTADVFRLFGVALGVCLVTAVPGAAVVVFGLGAPNYPSVLVSFWLSDAMGMMIVTPLVLAWGRSDWRGLRIHLG